MAHLSKSKLRQQDLDNLFEQLANVISKSDKRNSELFLSELLGKEEKIMLAKRLAAIVMFIEGNSGYRVWQSLKMSPSTTDRIRLKYEIGKYKNIEKMVKSSSADYEELWETIGTVLRLGMPSMGKDRWKSLR